MATKKTTTSKASAKKAAKKTAAKKKTAKKASAKKTTSKKAVAKRKSTTTTKRATSRGNGSKRTVIPAEDIARRAYQLFLMRGGEHGYAMEDWLMAEEQLRRENA